MNRWFKDLSLQIRLISAFLVIFLVLTFVLGYAFYNNTKLRVIDTKTRELTTLAAETVDKIERFLFERSADAKVLSESKLMTMNDVSKQIKIDYLKNIIEFYQTYDVIFIMDRYGNVLFSSWDEDETAVEVTTLKTNGFIDDMLKDNSYISDLVIDEASNHMAIYFSEPLKDENGIMIGTIVEKMNFNAINDIVNTVKLGENGHAQLVRNRSQEGLSTEKIGGIDHLTMTYPLLKHSTQKEQWLLLLTEPTYEAYAVLRDIWTYFGLVFTVAFIVVLIVSVTVSKRLTRPFSTLKKRIHELMSYYNLNDISNTQTSKDEVKALTDTFDFLLDELNFMMQKVLEKSGEAAYMNELKHSLNTVVEHALSGILTIDGKGTITTLNAKAREILNFNAESIPFIGHHLFEFNDDHPYIELITLLEKVYEHDNPLDDKNRLKDEVCYIEHSNTHILVTTLHHKDQDHAPLGFTVILQSQEDKEIFDNKIIRAKKFSELGELTAGVAHEIRNPLASIRGYTQMALFEIPDTSDAREDLKVVLSEVDRMDKIIERFLSFASPNQLVCAYHSVGRLIHEVVKVLEPSLTEKQIIIDIKIPDDDMLLMDFDQMKQVFINLLINAIQASPVQGHIDIHSERDMLKASYTIHVIDHGEGIDPEIQTSIFSPFYTTRSNGTGLGLSICAQIIENHSGSIDMTSEKFMGAHFTIRLPL
jgi:two-component system sensor histidine kinase AtoS